MTIFISSFLLSGCVQSDIEVIFDENTQRVKGVLYEKGSNLKYIYKVNGDNSKEKWWEYEYDNIGRISKANHYPSGKEIKTYDDYLYDVQGKIEKISSYQQYPSSNPAVLTKTVVFSYDAEGNKIKEDTERFDELPSSFCLFYFANNKLTMKKYYEKNQQTSFSVYEYEDDKLVKEKSYDMEGNLIQITESSFAQGLLVYSITYEGDPKSGFIRDDTRYYDQNDNLIRVIENDAILSSIMGATVRLIWSYEY